MTCGLTFSSDAMAMDGGADLLGAWVGGVDSSTSTEPPATDAACALKL